jgi:hypothetical protein
MTLVYNLGEFRGAFLALFPEQMGGVPPPSLPRGALSWLRPGRRYPIWAREFKSF